MAEAVAVIGLVSSIAALVELSAKIVSRVRDYSAHAASVPETFRALADRLPLLTQTLTHIRTRAQAGQVVTDVAQELGRLVNSILQEVQRVDNCLRTLTSTSAASRLDRVRAALKSLAKDDEVQQSVAKIHHGIDVLVLHQTTSAVEVGDSIRHQLGQLSLQRTLSQQSVSTLVAQRTLGLYLGSAPLIDADAFVGRQTEIQQLHDWLSPSQTTPTQRVVSIVGIGGLGKTQLSLAYAREHGNQYSSVVWLDAADETRLRQSMAAVAAVLSPNPAVAAVVTADEESRQVEQVRRWLSEAWNGRWLVIFDNYDDPSLPNIASPTGFDIRKFFPMRAQGSILITTRSSKLTFSKSLKLQKLHDVDLCLVVLSQRSGREIAQDPDARRLAVRLDGLPLALAVAGTYLAQTVASCSEYLDLYDTAWNDLHGPDAEVLLEYANRTLSSTWTISLEQVRRHDPDAASLLRFWGYLNHDDVWYELVQCGADAGPSWISRLTATKMRFDRAMSKLADYSLVDAGGGLYRIHPCLHDWIIEHLEAPPDESLFVTAIACLEGSILDSHHPQYWNISRRLVNHINRTQHSRFTILWDNLTSDEGVLDAGNSFGSLYKDLWELGSAEQMYKRTLAGRERVLGPNHVETLDTVNDLGNLYIIQGKLEQAEQILKRALTGRERALGPDHNDTLGSISNLGLLSYTRGKLTQAEQMYRRALAGYDQAFGPNDINTLCTLSNLSNIVGDQGKFEQAEQMCRQALFGYEQALGPDHVDVLGIINNLGCIYADQGKLEQAEQMYTRVLAGRERALGPDHVDTLGIVNNLALLYADQGKLEQAEQMYTRALAGCEQALGPDHTDSLMIGNNLGRLYQEQGKLEQAERMYKRALAGYKQTLGSDHPSTQGVVRQLESLRSTKQAVASTCVSDP